MTAVLVLHATPTNYFSEIVLKKIIKTICTIIVEKTYK